MLWRLGVYIWSIKRFFLKKHKKNISIEIKGVTRDEEGVIIGRRI